MPEYHSVNGTLHGGRRENCPKCNPKPPVPVVVEEVKPEPVVAKKPRARRKKVA